jgi:predicted Zn-ribbon and HTH transcriptional regulator
MSADLLIFIYVAVILGALCLIALYYERREQGFLPSPSKDRIFRCESCAFVYTDDEDTDLSRCPHCAKMNEPIEF